MTRQSERAESTQLSHLFGIAMTAIVITVALTGAADYVQTERAQVAEQQLETIGNRLAADVERVDELGRRGGQATVELQVQRTVSGINYEVGLGEGDTCETGNFHTDRCLVLETVGADARATVPLNVSAGFSISQEGGGTLRLAVDGWNSSQETGASTVDRTLRIGVGRDYAADRYATVGNDTNRPPVARFDVAPGNPRVGNPVAFTAAESFDPDRDIVQYRWDFNDDGIVDALGPNVSRQLPAGPNTVVLQVVDTEGATSTERKTMRVSGVRYEADLTDTDVGTDSGGAITFTVTNRWPAQVDSAVEITHVLIDPRWDGAASDGQPGHRVENECSSVGVACPYGSLNDDEVLVDAGLDGSVDGSGPIERDVDGNDATTEIPPDGVIVELDTPVTLFSGDSAAVWVGAFQEAGVGDLSGRAFEVGVRYNVDEKSNATVARDVVGAPGIDEYTVETGLGPDGNRTDGVVVSDQRLDRVTIQLGGALGGLQTDAGATRTQLPDGRWVHRLPLGDVADGVVKANLTEAKNDTVGALETRGPTSVNRTAVVFGGEYVWSNESDWDDSFVSERVVHDDIGSRTADSARLGYRASAANLTGYWHFDRSAVDASGNGRDGSPDGVGDGFGVFGSPGYRFGGGHVDVPGVDDIHSGTSSLAFWTKTTSTGASNYRNAPGVTGAEQVGTDGDIFWGWVDDTGRIGIQAGDAAGAKSDRPINDGSWHHVVLTYDENTGEAKLYIDGKLNDTATTDTGGTSMSFDEIGRIENTGASFDGKLDEVRSYDRVLDDADAEELATTKGHLRTDWYNGTTPVNASALLVQYEAAIPVGTDIEVTVEVDVDDDGTAEESSNVTTLLADEGSRPVGGLETVGDASSYRLRIEFETQTPTKAPVLYRIGLTER
jgi:general stress protein YciG